MSPTPGRLYRRLVARSVKTPFPEPPARAGGWTLPATRHIVVRYRVRLAGIEPLRIALLSDLHVGSHRGDVARFRQVCDVVAEAQADLVLLGGDYMNMMPWFGERVSPREIARIFAGLRTPLGVHAVLGNHDWDYGGEAVSEALSDAGIAVHENAGVRIFHRGDSFWLAGLAETVYRTPDMMRALAGASDGEPLIVISHDPACFAQLPRRPSLMVSGHTHAGQWRAPGLGPLYFPGKARRAWAHGLTEENGRSLVVSAGLGASGLPLRINCPPEIVLIDIA